MVRKELQMNSDEKSWKVRDGETLEEYLARQDSDTLAIRQANGQQYCKLCGNMIGVGFGVCYCGKNSQPVNY